MTKNAPTPWTDIVALMRRDPLTLGQEPGNGARFLRRVAASLEALAVQQRRAWDLSATESHAVTVLWEFGRMSMSELGRHVDLSRAAITTLADRLEEKGLIKRVPDPTDRRRILVLGTPHLENEMARVYGEWDDHVNRVLDRIGQGRRHDIVEFLTQLRAAAHTRVEDMSKMEDDELGVGAKPRARKADGLPPAW